MPRYIGDPVTTPTAAEASDARTSHALLPVFSPTNRTATPWIAVMPSTLMGDSRRSTSVGDGP